MRMLGVPIVQVGKRNRVWIVWQQNTTWHPFLHPILYGLKSLKRLYKSFLVTQYFYHLIIIYLWRQCIIFYWHLTEPYASASAFNPSQNSRRQHQGIQRALPVCSRPPGSAGSAAIFWSMKTGKKCQAQRKAPRKIPFPTCQTCCFFVFFQKPRSWLVKRVRSCSFWSSFW